MSQGSADGVYDHGTRFLSRLGLLVDGQQPLLLGSSVRSDNVSFSVDLTNNDRYVDGRNVLPRDTIHGVRNVVIWKNVAYQRVYFVNHGSEPARLEAVIHFGCDFADLFEARGTARVERGSSPRRSHRGPRPALLPRVGQR